MNDLEKQSYSEIKDKLEANSLTLKYIALK